MANSVVEALITSSNTLCNCLQPLTAKLKTGSNLSKCNLDSDFVLLLLYKKHLYI